MKDTNIETSAKFLKSSYFSPSIERIIIDSQISLALESAPPGGPGENYSNSAHYFNNDPFKPNMS
jgi:hypothetical protein